MKRRWFQIKKYKYKDWLTKTHTLQYLYILCDLALFIVILTVWCLLVVNCIFGMIVVMYQKRDQPPLYAQMSPQKEFSISNKNILNKSEMTTKIQTMRGIWVEEFSDHLDMSQSMV